MRIAIVVVVATIGMTPCGIPRFGTIALAIVVVVFIVLSILGRLALLFHFLRLCDQPVKGALGSHHATAIGNRSQAKVDDCSLGFR